MSSNKAELPENTSDTQQDCVVVLEPNDDVTDFSDQYPTNRSEDMDEQPDEANKDTNKSKRLRRIMVRIFRLLNFLCLPLKFLFLATRQVASTIGDTLLKAIETILKALLKFLLNMLKKLSSILFAVFRKFYSSILLIILHKLFSFVGKILKFIFGGTKAVGSTMIGAVNAIASAMIGVVNTIVFAIWNLLSTLMSFLISVIVAPFALTISAFGHVRSAIASTSESTDTVDSAIDSALRTVQTIFLAPFQSIRTVLHQPFSPINLLKLIATFVYRALIVTPCERLHYVFFMYPCACVRSLCCCEGVGDLAEKHYRRLWRGDPRSVVRYPENVFVWKGEPIVLPAEGYYCIYI